MAEMNKVQAKIILNKVHEELWLLSKIIITFADEF